MGPTYVAMSFNIIQALFTLLKQRAVCTLGRNERRVGRKTAKFLIRTCFKKWLIKLQSTKLPLLMYKSDSSVNLQNFMSDNFFIKYQYRYIEILAVESYQLRHPRALNNTPPQTPSIEILPFAITV